MIPDEMIIQTPPLDVHQESLFGVSQRPGFSSQRRDGLTDREVDALDKGRLDKAGKTNGFESFDQGFTLTPQHSGDGVDQFTTPFVFDELTIEELLLNLPVIGTGPGRTEPPPEVSGDGIEVRT